MRFSRRARHLQRASVPAAGIVDVCTVTDEKSDDIHIAFLGKAVEMGPDMQLGIDVRATARRSSAASKYPCSSAAARAVPSTRLYRLMSAPPSSKSSIIGTCPKKAASCRAVQSRSLSTWIPFLRSKAAILTWPLSQLSPVDRHQLTSGHCRLHKFLEKLVISLCGVPRNLHPHGVLQGAFLV